MNNQKVSYLLKSTKGYFSPLKCPSCGTVGGMTVDRKYLVTRLIRCKECFLLYRHPVDSPDFNDTYYNSDYVEPDGITTDLPSEQQLAVWKELNFMNSGKNISSHIKAVETILGPLTGLKLVDYGANWGYGSYQWKQRALVVESYELARDRASFGKNLGLSIKTKEEDISKGNDIFYSSHVIEHLPSVKHMLDVARRSLHQDGIFVAFCPNGSEAFRKRHPGNFHRGWGLVHPNYLTGEFYQRAFASNPYFISSSPYEIDSVNLNQVQYVGNLEGDELMVIAKINSSFRG
ncbi:MAG TPA: hypothetical protein PLX35_06015 [Cyclobacteriaceae bacterium]|nr:hypothetical protein [Cyclobacteriaceae bacterium]